MRPRTLDCPSCGAPVGNLDQRFSTCSHCGRTFAISFAPEDVERSSPALIPKPPTLGAILWQRFRPYLGAAGWVFAGLACAGAVFLIRDFYTFTERSAFGDEAILAAVLVGAGGLLLVAVSRKVLAILSMLAGGAALISKPFFYPMWSDFGGDPHPFSLTSETHLNFILPGILLVALALILSLTLRPGRPR